jgi:DNA polymerase-3 subunit gamma/tau
VRLETGSDWLDLLAGLGLKGPVRELAANAGFVSFDGNVLRVTLPELLDHLRTDGLVRQLAAAMTDVLGKLPKIEFVTSRAPSGETLHDRSRRERDQRQGEAEAAFLGDPAVQRLVGQYGARVQTDSIRPVDDK